MCCGESRQPPTTATPSQQGCACLSEQTPGQLFPLPLHPSSPAASWATESPWCPVWGWLAPDKPHTWGELIPATAGVAHAITSVLPAKKRLEQELPWLWFVSLNNLFLQLSIPRLCALE